MSTYRQVRTYVRDQNTEEWTEKSTHHLTADELLNFRLTVRIHWPKGVRIGVRRPKGAAA
jgi:hypothetical protein